jgi:hypothetical protein
VLTLSPKSGYVLANKHLRCTRFVSLEKYTYEGNASCLFTLFNEHFHCNYEERIKSLYSYNHEKWKQTENQQALKVMYPICDKKKHFQFKSTFL